MALLMDADENPLTDSSGEGNTGALKGANEPDYATASNPGAWSTGYYDWDGTDDLVTVTDDDTLDLDGKLLSFSFWVYNDLATSAIDQGFFDKADVNGDEGWDRYSIYLEWNRIRIRINGNAEDDTHYGEEMSWNDGWHHVYVEINIGGTLFLYVDGSTQTLDDTTENNATFANLSDNLLIGKSTTTNEFTNGKMDEMAMFNRALTSTEINDIKDNGLAGAAAPAARRIIMVN